MSTDIFELHIQQSLAKLEDLWLRSNSLSTSDSDLWQSNKELPQQQQKLLQESLAELSASIEELQIASETLRQQNTELLTSRQQIAAEREYYRDLFDSAADCYIITSEDGMITEVNQKATELLGVSPEYLISKTLAVFVCLDNRSEYYTKLNKIKQDQISTASWELEIMTRQHKAIAVECLVIAHRDRWGKIVDLRWRISPLKNNLEQNNAVNATPVLIDSLRYPLYNLVTQIKEIQAEDRIKQRETNRHWHEIDHQLLSLRNTINNAYIVARLKNSQHLNLSVVDYTTFIGSLIKRVGQSSQLKSIISFESQESCAGICDLLLLEQMLLNILQKTLSTCQINHQIQVFLVKESAAQLTIKINVPILKDNPDKTKNFFKLLMTNGQINLTSKDSLSAVAIQRCIYLLNAKLNLQPNDCYLTIAIALPLVSVINK